MDWSSKLADAFDKLFVASSESSSASNEQLAQTGLWITRSAAVGALYGLLSKSYCESESSGLVNRLDSATKGCMHGITFGACLGSLKAIIEQALCTYDLQIRYLNPESRLRVSLATAAFATAFLNTKKTFYATLFAASICAAQEINYKRTDLKQAAPAIENAVKQLCRSSNEMIKRMKLKL